MNKLITILFLAAISSTSAFAKGFYCQADSQNEDGKSYHLEALLQKNAINVLQLNWEIKDDRGHADDYETILEEQVLQVVDNYSPTSAKFQGYAKYKITIGSHSLETVEIFIPKILGSKKSQFLGYVKVVDEHAGLLTNEVFDCEVTE